MIDFRFRQLGSQIGYQHIGWQPSGSAAFRPLLAKSLAFSGESNSLIVILCALLLCRVVTAMLMPQPESPRNTFDSAPSL